MVNNIIKSVSISREANMIIERLSEKKNFNFSNWVNNKVLNELNDKEYLIAERGILQGRIEEINKEIVLMEKWQPSQDTSITREEIKFLKDSAKLIQNRPEFLNGRIEAYINMFRKNINKKAFIILLEKYKDIENNKS